MAIHGLTLLFVLTLAGGLMAAEAIHQESIEWTDIWVTQAEKNPPAVPRVLLVGDSIVRSCYGTVDKALVGQAACARYCTSLYMSHPDYLEQLAIQLRRYRFDVIYLNNGLHGWDYKEEEYAPALELLLAMVKKEAPQAKLVWGLCTPIRNTKNLNEFEAARNPRVIERNRIAKEVMARHGIAVLDIYEPAAANVDYFVSDAVHYNEKGQAALGGKMAEMIRSLLPEKK